MSLSRWAACGLAGIALMVSPAQSEEFRYRGLCEASAAVVLDATHFAVASDESRIVHIYRRGQAEPVRTSTLAAVSDIEAAARIDDAVVWLTSHSLSRIGEDRPNRRALLLTPVIEGPSLGPESGRVRDLRMQLASALGVTDWLLAASLNIEGLAATAEGNLLIGLRSPTGRGHAAVIRLDTPFVTTGVPVAAGAGGAAASPGADIFWLDLGGRAIRSLERVGTGARSYLILAGAFGDRDREHLPALFWWDGASRSVSPGPALSWSQGNPEALIAWGDGAIQILGDNEDACSDEDDPVEARWFPSVTLTL